MGVFLDRREEIWMRLQEKLDVSGRPEKILEQFDEALLGGYEIIL